MYEPLMAFLKEYSEEVDIFCFQEVFHTPVDKDISSNARIKIFSEVDNALSEFTGYHAPSSTGWDSLDRRRDQSIQWGLATFIRKSVQIDSLGEFFVYNKLGDFNGEPTSHPRNVQYIKFKFGSSSFTVCNFHGYWEPSMDKRDTKERVEQSRKIRRFLDQEKSKKILCGDFNLRPDTQSLEILERDMRNLIKEFGVTSTRSSYYSKEMKFADYILVSQDIEVKDFKVLQDEVSDHLPLYLEFI